MRSMVRLALILLGAVVTLTGMHFFVTGTQHGGPTTTSHQMATAVGVALVAAGVLLQAWPALTLIRRSWRPGQRLRSVSVSAFALVVGLGLVVAGAGYFADGAQAGAPGGRELDPASDGRPGEAGSVFDMWLGSALITVGLLVHLGLALMGGRRMEGEDGLFRTSPSSRPL